MKRIFYTFILLLCLFAFNIVNTYAYTEEQAIEEIELMEKEVIDIIDLGKDWSNSHASSLKSLINRSFFNKIENVNISNNIDLVIAELILNGHNEAANDLLLIKDTIVSKSNSIWDSVKIIEEYLMDNTSNGVVGSIDLFIQIRNSANNLKSPIADLIDIYVDVDYEDIINKIKQYDTVDELISLYDDIVEKYKSFEETVSKLEDKLVTWQNIFNDYHLEDYRDLFVDYFGVVYNKLTNKYRDLYNELETKLQNKLDEKITIICDETDITNSRSILDRNTKLYDIMSRILKVKNKVNTAFEEMRTLIKIEELIEKFVNQSNKIINRIDEAYSYTEQYIIDYPKLVLKLEADKEYVDINDQNGIIIYKDTNLDKADFIDKFEVNIGEIIAYNFYDNKVGTFSELQIEYKDIVTMVYDIIVKGDIAANGVFDITDVVKICDNMFGKEVFDEYRFIAADMNDDSVIDITDVVKLCDILFNLEVK